MTEILVVGLATSLDRYLWIGDLRAGGVNRPHRVEEQAGGKALHVARAATTLGASVRTVAVAGGRTGDRVRELAGREPWSTSWVEVAADTRVCTCVIDRTDTMTEFYEPVATLAAAEWEPIVQAVDAALAHGPAVAVVAGQLPAGVPRDGLAALVRTITDSGVPVVLDSAGPPLAAALAAAPQVVKVTAAEAADALGTDSADPRELARALVSAGAEHAVITRGAQGATYASAENALAVSAPVVAPAWPVGSGDSFTAGLAVARADGHPWDVALRDAAAAAAANAAVPVAAGFTATSAARYAAEVTVSQVC